MSQGQGVGLTQPGPGLKKKHGDFMDRPIQEGGMAIAVGLASPHAPGRAPELTGGLGLLTHGQLAWEASMKAKTTKNAALKLSKDTLRKLTPSQLVQIQGGWEEDISSIGRWPFSNH